MTPAQMLAKLPAKPAPTTDTGVKDFAQNAELSAYDCVKKKTCPVCGSKGTTEHYVGEDRLLFFYCERNRTHVYEIDEETGTCDRIEGWSG